MCNLSCTTFIENTEPAVNYDRMRCDGIASRMRLSYDEIAGTCDKIVWLSGMGYDTVWMATGPSMSVVFAAAAQPWRYASHIDNRSDNVDS